MDRNADERMERIVLILGWLSVGVVAWAQGVWS